jgi:hypothetical protein
MVVTASAARGAILGLGLMASAAALPGQVGTSVFDAGVSDLQSGAPVAGAEVLLPELRLMGRADSLGRVLLPRVPYGTHRVRVRFLGYAPSEVRLAFASDTTGAVFRLDRAAVALSTVDVTADAVPVGLRDFEIRRKQGIGRFLDAKTLEGERDRDYVTMAALRFPGLTTVTDAAGRPHVASTRSSCGASSRGSRGQGADRIDGRPKSGRGSEGGESNENRMSGSCVSTQPCLVQVFLDDIPLMPEDDWMVRTWDLSGVEYYTGASMPARYRVSGSACGVLLLWSKWR